MTDIRMNRRFGSGATAYLRADSIKGRRIIENAARGENSRDVEEILEEAEKKTGLKDLFYERHIISRANILILKFGEGS